MGSTVPTPTGGEQQLPPVGEQLRDPFRTHDLGYRVEVREHSPNLADGAVGKLVAYAAPDHEGRWAVHHRDGRSHPTSRELAAIDLWALILEPYPLAESTGPGSDGDDDLERTQELGRLIRPYGPLPAEVLARDRLRQAARGLLAAMEQAAADAESARETGPAGGEPR